MVIFLQTDQNYDLLDCLILIYLTGLQLNLQLKNSRLLNLRLSYVICDMFYTS